MPPAEVKPRCTVALWRRAPLVSLWPAALVAAVLRIMGISFVVIVALSSAGRLEAKEHT